MKKDWFGITQHQQKEYEQKAIYLIDRGYVQGKSVQQLAKEMFESENR